MSHTADEIYVMDGDDVLGVAVGFHVDREQRKATARLWAAAPDMLAALEAVMDFWGRDPLAFGDEASINSLAGRFAVVADQCRIARNAARGLEDS